MYQILLSPFSKTFFYEWKLDPNRSDYNIVVDQELEGNIHIPGLNDAVKRFMADHVIFNSHIKEEDEALYWVSNTKIYGLAYFNNGLTHQDILSYIQKPFNLTYGPLYRLGVIKKADRRCRLIIVLHHIIIDESSTVYFLRELSRYYNDAYYKSEVPSKQAQFSKISALSSRLAKKLQLTQEKSKLFWQKQLLDTEPIDLSFLRPYTNGSFQALSQSLAVQLSSIEKIKFSFDKAILLKLGRLKKQYKITTYWYSQIVLAILLHRYTGQNKFGISYPVTLQRGKDLIYGAQVNTNIIPYDFSNINNVLDLLNQVKAFIKSLRYAGIDHSYLPIAELVNMVSVSNKDVLNITFVQADLQDQSFSFDHIKAKANNSNSNLLSELLIEQGIGDEGINFRVKYKSAKVNLALLDGFIKCYKRLFLKVLDSLLEAERTDQQVYIRDYRLLSDKQYNQIIYKWNHTDKAYPDNKAIHQLFEEQVARTPDHIVIVYEEVKLTYKALNERANQLACLLQNYDIQADSLIALCLDRSEHMLIAILAVLKAGGAYVPIDPSYPNERIQYIVEDTSTKLVLTNEIHYQRLRDINQHNLASTNEVFNQKGVESCQQQLNILAIDGGVLQRQVSLQSTNNPNTVVMSNSLAYVIYTSGTTGKPKGVMVAHRGVVNAILSLNKIYDFSKGSNVTAFTSYVFDVSVSEFFTVLFRSGVLHLLSENVRADALLISRYMVNHNIHYVYLPPVLLSLLPKIKYEALYGIIYSGESCDIATGKYWSDNYQLYNYYGPTEATIYTSGKRIIDGDTNLIGAPISNTTCYVLDSNLVPLPIGAIGELYIGGIGLARGYLNRADLTAEKFIVNPFQTVTERSLGKNTRLYKTGDLVRWLPNGNLAYIGRNDFQVKVRGYRIELEEIEIALLGYQGVKQSVVLAKEHTNREDGSSGNKYLVGYYVAETKLDEEAILGYLQSKLPEYMVPAVFVQLNKLPLTINGKLDRKALPDPEFINQDKYVAPRNEMERHVCQIWAKSLGLPEGNIGIHDDFFRLGGDSILAIKLISKLNKELSSNINAIAIFKHNTVYKLVDYLNHNIEDNIIIQKGIVTKPEEQLLSFAQERLWFIEKYEEGTNAYNIPLLFKVANHVQFDIVETGIKSIITRHEILRSLIKESNQGTSYQLVMDDQTYPLEIPKTVITSQLQLDQALAKQINYIYDLSNEYPIKVCWYQLTDRDNNLDHYLSIVIHHIAFDGWSIDSFLKELQAYYKYYLAQSQGLSIDLNLPILTIQYKDFALWQKSYLTGAILNKQLGYWKDKLSGYETLNLVSDHPRPSQIDYAGQDIYFELDETTSIALRELAKELKISLYSVLLGGYYLMLRSYSNQDDIVIGTPVANRHYNQIEHLIGFFVNTLVLRARIDSSSLIKDFIKQVSHAIIEGQLYQDLPFEKLVEELRVAKDTSRHPIFQIIFDVQHFGTRVPSEVNEETDLTNLLQPYTGKHIYNVAKFDLTTFIDDSSVTLRGSFNYAISLYTEATIGRFIETYIHILKQLAVLVNNQAKQEHIRIADLNYLNAEQYDEIIYKWNDTDEAYPAHKTIHQLFEEQVVRPPDHIAVVYEEVKLTYKELNERANQLANYLIQYDNIQPDSLIALCLDRSEHMLIAILAVLKSGGAYVPIDPSYPDERIQYILADTAVNVILGNVIYNQRLTQLTVDSSLQNQVTYLSIDSLTFQNSHLLDQSTENPITSTTSDNLAYIIYTSGTTGKPKGVMQSHCNVVRLFTATEPWYQFNRTDIWVLFHSYVFDFSIWEIWGALAYGGRLVIPSHDQIRDLYKFYELCRQQQVTVLNQTPAVFYQFSDIAINQNIEGDLIYLRYIIFGGDRLNLVQLANWANAYGCHKPRLINMYGITETTVHVTYKPIIKDDLGNSSCIGKAIPDLRIYVLDDNLNPLPIGAIGELYIGGMGLARGYLNKPALTGEKFITNPFQSSTEKALRKNDRLYKTGDLVRWLSDGNLEYIGRNDFQVKVRGYRIELEEIEIALLGYQGVKQSVVLAKEHTNREDGSSGNKYLVGYYVAETKLDEEAILGYLQSKLPEYMVPAVFVQLNKLPLTINGKLDRKALPDPECINQDKYVAPRNEIEKKICQVWAEVLGLDEDKVSIHDDFFRLGGNSILAIRLISKLNKELSSNIHVAAIFKHNTVYKLVYYSSHHTKDNIIIQKGIVTKPEEQLLSFAQERLWFIEKYEGGTNAYNIPLLFKVANHVQFDIVETSIKSIITRHEILRSLIKESNQGTSYQLIMDDQAYPLEIPKTIITSQLQLDQALAKQINYIYDLSNEYPIKVCWYQLTDRDNNLDHYLSIVIHHIAFDGWSIDSFLKELQAYYKYHLAQSQGLSIDLNLPVLTIQYKDFALWQKSYLTGAILNKQLGYWKDKLSGYETLNLVSDYPRPSQIDYAGQDIYFELDETTSTALRELAKELKISLYSVLLGGYYLMLRSYSNQDDIVIGTPVANRHYNQIEHLIGFFVNTLVLRARIDSSSLIKDFIKQVGHAIIEGQLHQDLPFEKLVEELRVAKDTSRHPIFQIMFDVQHFGTRVPSEVNKETDLTNLLQPYTGKHIYNVAKFDLTTFIDDSSVTLRGSFNYAISLYTEATIGRFIETYIHILKQLAVLVNNQAKQEHIRIADLNYLNAEQYDEIIYNWNDTDKAYPAHKTIHQLFEEQVERVPENLAVICEERKITYRALNARANRLAHYLIQHYEIKPDSLVALCLDRSEYMLIAILAVLKAGGAYVPIDPSYPDERIRYILTDTSVNVILGNEIYNQRFTQLTDSSLPNPVTYLSIDGLAFQDSHLANHSTANPLTSTTSDNLAYIIYTSGTTGKPKGVMQPHCNMVRLFTATEPWYQFNRTDIWVLFHSYVFDFSIWEIWGALAYGGRLVIPSHDQIRDLYKFYELCRQQQVTVLNQTPAVFYQFSDIAINQNIEGDLIYLRYIIFGGDRLNLVQLANWTNAYGCHKPKLINMYGITETTVHVTYKPIIKDDLGNSSCIGKAIPDLKVYVLNDNLNPLPIGAIGALHIGGAGLARGYLNKPALTKEKFIRNPFQSNVEKALGKHSRLYKTGDLVRWLPDGNLEYIGRNDFQVKIRGYRIELGEIENALSSYTGIKQSVVFAKEARDHTGNTTGNKYLVAYYVSNNELDQESIIRYLQFKLPEYMIPNMLVYLEKFPLTINGKLDSKSLPDPAFTDSKKYVAPRNEVEEKLCEIWSEVLGIPKEEVGIKEDFFRLGGDSIISIQLVSKVRQSLGLNLSIKNIFTYRSIEKLYDNILLKALGENRKEISIKAEQQILSGNVPLLPIQEWFFLSNLTKYNHWNQSFIVNTPPLDIARLGNSLEKLIRHHDAFRLKYNLDYYQRNTLREAIQYYDHTAPVESLKLLDIKSLGEEETSKAFKEKLQNKLTEWQSNFDLEKGPLYSIGYLYGYRDGSARIHFGLHHLLVDTVSWRILVEDLSAVYHGKALGIKGSSYRQWVETVKEDAFHYISEKHYWAHVLLDCAINSALGKLAVEEVATNDAEIILSRHTTQALLQESSKAYNTQIAEIILSRHTTHALLQESNKAYNTQIAEVLLSRHATHALLQESNKAYNTQINDILLTALGYMLAELTGNKVNHITLEGHGREEIDPRIEVTRTVGWFTSMYPVRLAISNDIGESIKHIKETLRQIPNNGVRYGVLMGYEEENILPKVSFNYLGQFNKKSTVSEGATNWHITDEDSGASIHVANKDYYILNINGLVIDGQLQFTISSRLNATSTSKVATFFKSILEEVISYTVNQPRSYLTVSDIHNIIKPAYLHALQHTKEIEGVYLANSLQQGFIYHTLRQGHIDEAYRVQLVWDYNSSIEVEKLKQSWKCAQKKYPSLRLRFSWQEELVQVIDKEGELDWVYVDLSTTTDSDLQEQKIKALAKETRDKSYDLQAGILFRLYLIKRRSDLYTCIFSNHHAILDGWSTPVLLSYVHETYLNLISHKEIHVEIDQSYELAQKYMQDQALSNRDYWTQYVAQLEEYSDLSGLLLDSSKQQYVKLHDYKHIKDQQQKWL